MKNSIRKARIAIPIIILLLFSVPHINDSYFVDEMYSINNAKTLSGIYADVHPPLYTLLLKAWMLIVGDGEAMTRALSLIFAALSVLIVTRINYNAGLLLSLSTIVHGVSVIARSYSLLLLFGAIGAYYLNKKKRHLYIPTILMGMTHYYGIFISMGIHAYDIYNKKSREAVRGMLVWGAVCASWIIFHATRMDIGAGGWIEGIRIADFMSGALGSTYQYAFILWALLLWKMPVMESILFSFSLIPPIIISIARPILYAHYTIALLPFTMAYMARRFRGRHFVMILVFFILIIPLSSPVFMSQDYKAAYGMISEYDNPMIISLETYQGHYFGAQHKTCEHVICIEWAMLEEHDSIWLLNGAFADANHYAQVLLESYEEEIFWFDMLEVRRYTPKVTVLQ